MQTKQCELKIMKKTLSTRLKQYNYSYVNNFKYWWEKKWMIKTAFSQPRYVILPLGNSCAIQELTLRYSRHET